MSKAKQRAEQFLNQFNCSVNYKALSKADQITNSKLFFLNLLCPELFITQTKFSAGELYRTYKNELTSIKQNYGLTKKIEETLSLNLDSNSRLCYEIIKFYYMPLNQIIDEAFLSVDNLDERFNEFKEDFIRKNEGDSELAWLVKRKDEMFKDVAAKIVLPQAEGIDNLHSIIDSLKVYQNSINDSKTFTQYIKTEKKEPEQDEKTLFAKKLSVFVKTNHLLSYISEVIYDIEGKYSDPSIKNQFIANRIGLLLKEITESQELFIKADLNSDMSILSGCLNKIQFIDESICQLSSLRKNIGDLVSQVASDDKAEYVKEVFQNYADNAPLFKKVLSDYENGARKLFLFDLENSGIKLDRFINLNRQQYSPEDLNILFSIIKHKAFNIEELIFKEGETVPISFFAALNDNNTLTSLSFKGCRFQLKEIKEAGSRYLGGAYAIAEILRQNSKIKSLALSSASITDQDIEIIADALKQNKTLKKLDLSPICFDQDPILTNHGINILMEALKSNDTLEELILTSVFKFDSGDEGAVTLADALKVNIGLKKLDISENKAVITDRAASSFASALEHNRTLEELNLRENNITDVGVKDIAKALKINKTLKELVLTCERGQNITDVGVTYLADALKSNQALQRLYVFGAAGSDGIKAIADSLELNSSLKEIDVFNFNANTEQAKRFASALKINKSLTKVRIICNNNDAENEVVQELAEALIRNKTLKEIIVSARFTDQGIIALCNALKGNSYVKKVELTGANLITENGENAIAELIRTNQTITHIELSRIGISDKGAKSIAESLKVNTELQTMSLVLNKFTDEGASAIAEALKINKTLQHLDLENNKIKDELAMVEVFNNNNTLTNCYIPVAREKSLLIDILNKKCSIITKELQAINFSVNKDDIISKYARLMQLSEQAQFLSIPKNTLDSCKRKVIDDVQYYIPNLITRCDLWHKLYLMEKGSKANAEKGGGSCLQKLYTSMFWAFDQIIHDFLGSQFKLEADISSVNTLFHNPDDVVRFLKLLEESEFLNLDTAADEYKGIIEADKESLFKVVPLVEKIISSMEYTDLGGLDDEKSELNYQLEIKKHLVNEPKLRTIVTKELRKILSAQEAGILNIVKILTNQEMATKNLTAAVISSFEFAEVIKSTPEELQHLIAKSKLNVNTKNENGLPLISAAVYAKNPGLVKFLLENGASLATGTYDVTHPLVAVVMQGNQEMAEALVGSANKEELISELGRSDIFLSTPFHLALHQGQVGIARTFLEHGANPKLKKNGDKLLTNDDLKRLLPGYEVDNIKSVMREKYPAIYAELSVKKFSNSKDYLAAVHEYGLDDIASIEGKCGEMIDLAGDKVEDHSCWIS